MYSFIIAVEKKPSLQEQLCFPGILNNVSAVSAVNKVSEVTAFVLVEFMRCKVNEVHHS